MQTMMFVTAKDGSAAKCVGDEGAMNAIQAALEAAGFRFSDEVGTWHDGFYDEIAEIMARPE